MTVALCYLVISNDKCIDVMGLNKAYLICIFICIFMNINENVKNKGKYIAFARFWIGHKTCLGSLGSILMADSVIRGATLMP